MKYTSSNIPTQCYMKSSTCYKQTTTMTVKGILWHSTGVNNPNIKRYVQPDSKNSNKSTLLKLIGTNTANNDWNHTFQQAGVNAWIGKLADGSVSTVQTLPWNYKPWGCGAGPKGSCNNGWIQFEICEASLTDATYFNKVYKEAVELTAYLCKKYNLNPKGKTSVNGVSVPVILCHADSYQLGLGTGHADVLHWFKKHGKTMSDVRNDVEKLLNGTTTNSTLQKGSTGTAVKTLQTNLNKLCYNCGTADGSYGDKTVAAVKKFQDDNGIDGTGKYGEKTQAAMKKALDACFKVKITSNKLNIRSGAGTSYDIKDSAKKDETYIIVKKSSKNPNWGKLAYSKGWINLNYTKKV